MENLYHQTNGLLQQVQSELARLERTGAEEYQAAENQLQAQVDHVISNCERLDILVMKEPPVRRANAKQRVSQLKYDCQHIQSFMRQLQHKRYVKQQEDDEREALLSRTFTTNDSEHSVTIDPALQHHTKLSESNRAMDDLIGHGSNIISNLRDQRGMLKGAHRRILDISNTLGLTNTVMRLIEKRTDQDKIIMFVLMVVCCIIMYCVWKYFSG